MINKLLLLSSFFVCFGLIAQTTYNVPEMMYYKFDLSGSGTVENEAVPSVGSNFAPLQGGLVQNVPGQFINGLQGTGVSSTTDYVSTGWPTNLSGDWTISFWIDAPEPSGTRYIWGDFDAASFRCFAGGIAPTNGLVVRGTGWTDIQIPDCLGSFGPSVVHITYDDATGETNAYVNGSLVNTVTQTPPVTFSGGTDFAVGAYSNSSSSSLEGVMDEFRMYDRALDANEIGLTYNQELPFTVVCSVPSNFSESNITSSSADVSWDHGGSNDNYVLEYGQAGFTQGSGTSINGVITTASNTENLTGLNANTTYEYYITEDCNGGADQLTFGPYTFTTTCGLETTPFTENFEDPTWDTGSGDINPCWSRNPATGFAFESNTGGTGSTNTGPSAGFGGTGNYLYTEGSSGSTGDLAQVTSPEIDLTPLTSPYMTFYYHMYGSEITQLDVEISDDAGSTWTQEGSIVGQQQSAETDAWEVYPIDLSAYVGQAIIVRFSTTKGAGFECDLAIDELVIQEAPSCPFPSDFLSSNVTGSSVDLTWTPGGSEAAWNVEYGPTGFTQGTGTVVAAAASTYTLTGLNSTTCYDVYVQADCGGGDASDWVGPISFCTTVSAINCTSGFNTFLIDEEFENGIPTSWMNTATGDPQWELGTGGTGSSNTGPSGAYSGNEYLFLETSGGITGDSDTLKGSADLSQGINEAQMYFYYHMYGADMGELIVEISDDNGATWTTEFTQVGQSQTAETDPWTAVSIDLTPYLGSVIDYHIIGVRGTGFTSDMAIDLFRIETCVSCPQPSDLTVNNVTSSSADIGWTIGNSETEWIIEYDTAGFTLGSGMTMVTTNNPETLTGLMPNTTYEAYLRGICGPGDTSSYTVPVMFTTECDVFQAISFCESFDSDSETQSCWTVLDENGDTDAWDMDYSFNTNTGDEVAAMYTDFNGGSNDDWLISPQITLTANEVMSFFYRVQSSNEPNDFEVLLSTTGTNPADFEDTLMYLASYQNTTYEDSTIDLSAYSGDVYVAFHIPSGGLDGWRLYIDDVCFDVCVPAQGQDGSTDVCRLDDTLNLNDNIIVKGQENGTWQFPGNQQYIVDDSMFVVSNLPAGDYDVLYVVEGGCTNDTTVATISVYPPSSAGENGSLTVCLNEPIDLFSGLNGNADLGGTWYDPSNDPLPNSQPTASNIPGNYNFDYITSNGVCPADTALVEVIVDGTCDWLSIGEEAMNEISVYPNPATNVINVVNPTNMSALKIEIVDVNGRVVATDEKALENSTEGSIAIDHLETGIYTLRIYGENGQKTFKIVKK